MTHPARTFAIPFLVAAAVLTGCDTGTNPSLLGLEPEVMATAVNGLISPLRGGAAAAEAGDNLRMAFEDLSDQGVVFSRPVESLPVPSASAWGALSSLSGLPLEVPPALQGETLVYDPSAGRWEPAEGRTGAPSTGVRIIWYEIDGSGEVATPLTERGHADLTPVVDPDVTAMSLVVMETAGGSSRTILDYVQGYRTEGDVEWTRHFEAAGSFSDGSRTTEFTLTSDETGNDDTDDETYEFGSVLDDGTVRYEIDADGTLSGATNEYVDHIDAIVNLDGARTVLSLMFEGVQGGGEVGSGTLTHDGGLVADVKVERALYSFTDPDGESFPGPETSELNTLFGALLINGFVPMFELPLVTR